MRHREAWEAYCKAREDAQAVTDAYKKAFDAYKESRIKRTA